MTTGNKIMWKRGEIAPKEQFLLFFTLFYIIFLTSGVKLHIHLLNVVVQFIVFLTLSTLICRGTDISKCFSESLGIRDNESRCIFQSIWPQPKLKKWHIVPDKMGCQVNIFFYFCTKNNTCMLWVIIRGISVFVQKKKKNIHTLWQKNAFYLGRPQWCRWLGIWLVIGW